MRFDWTRTFVAISTAAMESSWTYVLLLVLTVRPSPEMSEPMLRGLAIFALVAGSLAYTALLDFLGLRSKLFRALFIVLALFATLWAVKGGLSDHFGLFDGESWRALFAVIGNINDGQFLRTITALGAGLLLCWRGAALHQMELETPARSFRLGIVVSSFSVLIGALFFLDIQAVAPTLIQAIVSFFFFGLLGVAVTQLRRERTGPKERPGTRWFLVFLPAIGFILLVGVALATIFSPEEMGEIVVPLWNRIVDGLVWLVTPVVVAGYALMNFLLWLFRGPTGEALPSPAGEGTPPPLIETVTPLEELVPTPVRMPGPWRNVVAIVVVILIFLGILYLIWHYLSRTRREDDILEERESLWSWDELAFSLRGWWENLRQRLFRERIAGLRALLDQLQGPPTTVTIRKAYIRLLLLALERDLDRREGQTPQEYLPTLRRGMPQHAAETDTLTGAYVQARYDPRPAPEDLARQAESAWEEIERREQRS